MLRRVHQLEALACPRCSPPAETVPMIVLAFLTDPEVVGKILHHLGLPTCAPPLARARSSAPGLGFKLAEEGPAVGPQKGEICGGIAVWGRASPGKNRKTGLTEGPGLDYNRSRKVGPGCETWAGSFKAPIGRIV